MKRKPNLDFLDLFVHRMNMKESQGIDRPRTSITGEIKTADTQFDTPASRNFLPERGEWEKEREQWIKLGEELPEEVIKDWDYEQKIDRTMDLELFRALEKVHVPKKEVPPLRQLAPLFREKGSDLERSVDAQKKMALRVEKAWQEALADLELRLTQRLPLRLINWEDEKIFPLGHTKSDAARILGIDRKTLYNWIEAKPKKIRPSATDRIPISEIKRIMSGDAPVIE